MQNVISQEQFATSKMFPTGAAKHLALWHGAAMREFEAPQLHLAAWRQDAGLSQEKLAVKIGYSRGYIAKSETQPQNVTLQFLSSYAEGVGAPSVPALFKRPEDFNAELVELQRYFLLISGTEQRQTVVNVAKGLSEQYAGASVESGN